MHVFCMSTWLDARKMLMALALMLVLVLFGSVLFVCISRRDSCSHSVCSSSTQTNREFAWCIVRMHSPSFFLVSMDRVGCCCCFSDFFSQCLHSLSLSSVVSWVALTQRFGYKILSSAFYSHLFRFSGK